MRRNYVIAIDGPAGTGKSTVARTVADRLSFRYIDSGALYRTYTLVVLKNDVSVDDVAQLKPVLQGCDIEMRTSANRPTILLNGEDITEEIRSQQVTEAVSACSRSPEIRQQVVQKLRAFAQQDSVVVEGRDIGTVVFPQADLKFFLSASLEERAKRRFKELKRSGIAVDFEKIKADIYKRDKLDSERDVAPLKKAEDAMFLDTTHLSIEECVNFIIKEVQVHV